MFVAIAWVVVCGWIVLGICAAVGFCLTDVSKSRQRIAGITRIRTCEVVRPGEHVMWREIVIDHTGRARFGQEYTSTENPPIGPGVPLPPGSDGMKIHE